MFALRHSGCLGVAKENEASSQVICFRYLTPLHFTDYRAICFMSEANGIFQITSIATPHECKVMIRVFKQICKQSSTGSHYHHASDHERPCQSGGSRSTTLGGKTPEFLILSRAGRTVSRNVIIVASITSTGEQGGAWRILSYSFIAAPPATFFPHHGWCCRVPGKSWCADSGNSTQYSGGKVLVCGGIDNAPLRPYAVLQDRGKLFGHGIVQLLTSPTGGNYLGKEEDIPCGSIPSSSVLFLILDIYSAVLFFLAFRYYAPLAMVVVSIVQTIFGIWKTVVSGNASVPDLVDNYEFHLCLYAPKNLGRASEVFVLLTLGYDTLVFFLTLGRTSYMFWRRQGQGPRSRSLVHNMVQDGVLYFAAISSVNVFWTTIIFCAPAGLQSVAALPSACVTAVVIGRITLNLREVIYVPDGQTTNADDITLSTLRVRQPTLDVFGRVSAASHPHTAAAASSVEDFDEDRCRHLSEPSGSSRSLRKMDPDA
ncbi:hypothetical protein EVG20_g7143 [Dentipellis fragilis]|uniref:Transmembrane protein n=1 Tax=Dentipellis fragilis TaxID=205917 RepID=A0A4Y9YG77_9AGAM|nr:hypothetical protein EVG20_g7143 [Dentipellis fragilis]